MMTPGIILMKLITMADGLFLYKTDDFYIVMDQNNNLLKKLKHARPVIDIF